MGHVMHENPEQILGRCDEYRFAAIQASEACMKDIKDAKAVADGESDIAGQGGQVIPGPVKEVLTILLGETQ